MNDPLGWGPVSGPTPLRSPAGGPGASAGSDGGEEGALGGTHDVETRAAMLETLADTIDAALWIVDAGTDSTLFVNQAWGRLHGRPVEDAYEDPMCWLEQVHEDDVEDVLDWIEADATDADDHEFRLHHPERGTLHLLAEAHEIPAPVGEGQWYVGTTSDVTQRREEQRRRRGTEQLYGWLLESAGAVVFRVHGHPEQASVELGGPNVEAVTGFEPSAFDEDRMLWFERVHPEDRDALAEDTVRAYEEAEELQGIYRFDPAGEDGWTWHEYHFFPDRDADDGDVTGVTGFTVDVTERMQAREQLERNLQETTGALDRFADVAAHDLKEPLRWIATHVQRVQQALGEDLDPEQRDNLQTAVDGAKHAHRLIDEIREFTRVGHEADQREPTPLDPCLDAALDALAPLIAERDATVTTEPLPSAMCNRDQVARVLEELVENALRFQDEPPVRVHVHGYRHRDRAVVLVEDGGIGIDAAYHEKVFELFERLHGPDEYGGTGLGLGLARRIVQRHGGEVWVDSELGAGSRFFVSLPASD